MIDVPRDFAREPIGLGEHAAEAVNRVLYGDLKDHALGSTGDAVGDAAGAVGDFVGGLF